MCAFQIADSWDWSGAGHVNQNRHGIARATWQNLNYVLARGFTRNQVIQAMQAHVISFENGCDVLVGFDFPFSFPFAAKGNHFLDNSAEWWTFSTTVHQTLQNDGAAWRFYGCPQLYGQGGFADHF